MMQENSCNNWNKYMINQSNLKRIISYLDDKSKENLLSLVAIIHQPNNVSVIEFEVNDCIQSIINFVSILDTTQFEKEYHNQYLEKLKTGVISKGVGLYSVKLKLDNAFDIHTTLNTFITKHNSAIIEKNNSNIQSNVTSNGDEVTPTLTLTHSMEYNTHV